jgi:UDP-N-acetylglucosamine--N-acetylmuramyl-(pentapeptide) pyrophosphoryl-undecaprenol N-acetylglucosamine transferase
VSRTILIMAAGTGGHIFPGLAIARELHSRGWDVHWMGTPCGDGEQARRRGRLSHRHREDGGRAQQGPVAWALLPLRLLIAFWQASVAIFRIRPTSCSRWAATSRFPAG